MRDSRPSARILLADNLRLVAEACKHVLEPEFAVVGIVSDGRDLLGATAVLKPDIIVLDTKLFPLDGLEAAEQLKSMRPSAKLIFLSDNTNAQVAAEAFRRGAFAYVTKQSPATELLDAIRRVNQGNSYVSPLVALDTVTCLLNNRKQPGKKITARQYEILQLLAEGKTMKQVAAAIDVQVTTVQFHKYRMMNSLNVNTTAELLNYAFRRQLGSMDSSYH